MMFRIGPLSIAGLLAVTVACTKPEGIGVSVAPEGRMPEAQSGGTTATDDQTGLKIGTKAPNFTLNDQSGTERSLDEFLGKDKVALVFYRSADW